MNDFLWWIINGILMCIIGFSLGNNFASDEYKTQAVDRGYALHCPDTGDFAWKGECDE